MNRETTTITIVSIISVILLGIIGFLIYFILEMDMTKLPSPIQTIIPTQAPQSVPPTQISSPTTAPIPTNPPTVLPTTKPTITPTNPPVASDLELVRLAMAKKHNRPVAETNISISKNNGTHIWGSVSFTGDMGGGWFLAAKQSGSWIIVDDGNGTIECSVIAPYNFPADMVPECYNSITDQLIKR